MRIAGAIVRIYIPRLWHIKFPFLPDGAPTTLVSLIGHKQYRRCARDIYYFSQVKSLSHTIVVFTLLCLPWSFSYPLEIFSAKLTILSSCVLVFYMCEATCLCNFGTCTCLHLSWDSECCGEYSPTCIEFFYMTCGMASIYEWNWEEHVLVFTNTSIDQWFCNYVPTV